MFYIKKIIGGIIVLMAVVALVNSIIYLADVNPERQLFGENTDEETVAQKRKELGLDKSLGEQIWSYYGDLSPIQILATSSPRLTDYNFIKIINFGESQLILKTPYLRRSFINNEEVGGIIGRKLPKTAALAILAILLAAILGILIGVLAALNKGTWIDNFAVGISVTGYSLPSYVTAMIFALVFAYWLGDWTGFHTRGGLVIINDFGDLEVRWRNIILPALALGIRPIGVITQLTRSAMLDTLEMDFVRTAKAKGLSKYTVYLKHALRNALNPVVTALTAWFASLLAGAFFVEKVFQYDGIGLETVEALQNMDIPVVMGVVLSAASIFIIINILVDVVYKVLDPRV